MSTYLVFEYTVMLFGLTNAPTIFQYFMNDTFRDLLDQFLVIYIDNILIYFPSLESHQQHLHLVLQWVRENSLYAKLEKCQLFQLSIDFLGHHISPEGVAMEPHKVESLCSWQPPQQVKDVQRLLGFANYYWTFILGFASLTVPLTCLLHKKIPF